MAEPLPQAVPEILDALVKGDEPISQTVERFLIGYGDRPALFWRTARTEGGKTVYAPDFTSITYAGLWEQVQALNAVLANDERFGLKAGDAVCTLGFAGPEYVALNLALLRAGLASVPLQTAATTEQIKEIAREVKPQALASSIEALDKMVAMAEAVGQPTAILVFDYDPQNEASTAALEAAGMRAAAATNRISLLTFVDAVDLGKTLPQVQAYAPTPDENPISIIFYTSGSTGSPKGAIYRNQQVKPFFQGIHRSPQVTVHYQPLSHGFGLAWTFIMLASGGLTYFTAKSDLSSLIDDIAFAKPTNMPLVPRVCELIYQRAQSEKNARPGITTEELREELLGGRLKQALTGSAPLSPELKAFIDDLFGFEVVDGYGATEVGSVAVNGVIQKPPVIDYKLIDVPELGYFTTDRPHPRGELVVKTERIIEGYLGRDDLNAKLIDAEGFYHTGDIMEETSPGVIRYLDRRNNVLKLSQGEFVTLAKLEALYSYGHPALDMVYVYGNSSRSYLLAVVVPNKANLDPALDGDALRSQLIEAVRIVAAEKELNSFEIPRNIIVEHEPFSRENGLLSGIGKYLRPQFKDRYQEPLEALYSEMARQQESELDDLRKNGSKGETTDIVVRAARSVLGVDEAVVTSTSAFADLGGDSLSAVSFSLLLEDIFGIPVDVGMIMHPTGNLTDLAKGIDQLRSGGMLRPTMETIHGDNPTVASAADLTLDRVIDPAILEAAKSLDLPADVEPQVVLLTGANGFLGRFMCMDWLERMERNGSGTLICVLRGSDDASAYRRLEQALDAGDDRLIKRFRELAAKHLRVYAGDLALPNLGLSAERWQELAETVDLIAHPGALVNHKLHYRQLFQPNVMGTADLIALALTHHMKRFVNVSTMGVAVDDSGMGIAEDDDVRVVVPHIRIRDSYANGYRISKWAGEVLLREAAEKYRLPVNIFRSNMILAHSQYIGQLNVPDMFTRLLLSIVATGVAPESFYSGDPSHAHYEGLPVDFIASAINSVGEKRRSGMNSFHVLSPHDDGVSLDSFVGWMQEEGYQISKFGPYADWLERFEIALKALPERVRNASVLPVLDAYGAQSPVVPGGNLPSERFVQGVADAGVTSDGLVPHLSRETVRKYLNDLQALGLVEPARALSPAA